MRVISPGQTQGYGQLGLIARRAVQQHNEITNRHFQPSLRISIRRIDWRNRAACIDPDQRISGPTFSAV
jgi:hypothetical protein